MAGKISDLATVAIASIAAGSKIEYLDPTDTTEAASGTRKAVVVADLNPNATNVSNAGASMISSGAGAPASTPAKVGNIYIDLTNDRIYIATDTAGAADWDLVPITAAQILALLVTVDGTGSGLDADMLDGLDAAAFVPDSIIDAKGDLIVGTAADTPGRLPVGATTGHVLTVDPAEVTGMKWAAAAGGGSSDPLSADFIITGRMFAR